MNHFLLLCSPFVRDLSAFIAISTTFSRQRVVERGGAEYRGFQQMSEPSIQSSLGLVR
jgi:hypothetical protein